MGSALSLLTTSEAEPQHGAPVGPASEVADHGEPGRRPSQAGQWGHGSVRRQGLSPQPSAALETLHRGRAGVREG